MAKAFCVGGEPGWVRLNNPRHFLVFFSFQFFPQLPWLEHSVLINLFYLV